MSKNSDNPALKAAAGNEKMQSLVGSSIASLASNESVRRSIGNAVAAAAEDKETQKVVAGAIWSGTKKTGSIIGSVAGTAASAYWNSGSK